MTVKIHYTTRIGTELFTGFCIVALWSNSELPWWLFAALFFGGTIINHLTKQQLSKLRSNPQ